VVCWAGAHPPAAAPTPRPPCQINPNILKTQYAVRGEIYLKADQMRKAGRDIIFTNSAPVGGEGRGRRSGARPLGPRAARRRTDAPAKPVRPCLRPPGRAARRHGPALEPTPALAPAHCLPRLPAVGNPHNLGAKPKTFTRQVIALCAAPWLMDEPRAAELFPADALARARALSRAFMGGVGSYSDSRGNPFVRAEVAAFIGARDGHAANPDVRRGAAGGGAAWQRWGFEGTRARGGGTWHGGDGTSGGASGINGAASQVQAAPHSACSPSPPQPPTPPIPAPRPAPRPSS
jgi:hypothetical protein